MNSLANPRSLKILRSSQQSTTSGKAPYVNIRKGSQYDNQDKKLDMVELQPNLTNQKDIQSPMSDTAKPGLRKSIGRDHS